MIEVFLLAAAAFVTSTRGQILIYGKSKRIKSSGMQRVNGVFHILYCNAPDPADSSGKVFINHLFTETQRFKIL